MADREEKLARREAEVKAAEDRMRRWSEHLRDRESEFEVRELQVVAATKLAALPTVARTKTGRNEGCPCGSGVKYKHCHGLPGR